VEQAAVGIQLEPPRFEVAALGPSRGPSEATVTIVEFSDFQCPYCRRAGAILDELLERYPDDVRVVYRHMPLESIHPRARPAAVASLCAEQQGLFWEFHDAVFAGPNPLEDADLLQLATGIGADLEAFDACRASGSHEARVDADVAAARELGITGTPAFLVNGVMLRGAQPVAAFERIIEHELALARGAP
jgi:protein-disulfide isomerase